MVVGAHQSFQFFSQKTGFVGITEVYLNLGTGFCITWLVLPNYKKTSPQTNFKLTTRTTLNVTKTTSSVLFITMPFTFQRTFILKICILL